MHYLKKEVKRVLKELYSCKFPLLYPFYMQVEVYSYITFEIKVATRTTYGKKTFSTYLTYISPPLDVSYWVSCPLAVLDFGVVAVVITGQTNSDAFSTLTCSRLGGKLIAWISSSSPGNCFAFCYRAFKRRHLIFVPIVPQYDLRQQLWHEKPNTNPSPPFYFILSPSLAHYPARAKQKQ